MATDFAWDVGMRWAQAVAVGDYFSYGDRIVGWWNRFPPLDYEARLGRNAGNKKDSFR
jgi:hypothetical protein